MEYQLTMSKNDFDERFLKKTGGASTEVSSTEQEKDNQAYSGSAGCLRGDAMQTEYSSLHPRILEGGPANDAFTAGCHLPGPCFRARAARRVLLFLFRNLQSSDRIVSPPTGEIWRASLAAVPFAEQQPRMSRPVP